MTRLSIAGMIFAIGGSIFGRYSLGAPAPWPVVIAIMMVFVGGVLHGMACPLSLKK